MTDKKIIKALECCSTDNCTHCVYDDGLESLNDCTLRLTTDALDLINRQQSEIDRLKDDIFCISNERDAWKDTVNTTATEAIKEFINELMIQMPEHMMRTKPQPEEWRIKRWLNFDLDKLYPELVKNGSFFDDTNV